MPTPTPTPTPTPSGSDTAAPTVSITFPSNGSAVSGTIEVSANAADNVGVAGVQFKLNGANLDSENVAAPWRATWNTTQSANGTYTLTAVARDAAGNATTSGAVTVTVNNVVAPPPPTPDTTAPSVSITSPAGGATVSGTMSVSANASDNVGVVGVQFKVDGVNLGAEDTSAPFGASWNTSLSGNGSHSVTAVARDAAGNSTTSGPATVTVSNTTGGDTTAPSVPTGLGATVVSSSQIRVNWSAATDNVGVTGYKIYRNGTQVGTSTDTSHPVTGLSPSTTYSFTVAATDAAGNTSAQSAPVSATTTAAADTTAPTVSITAPAGGTTLTGVVSVTGNAADNVGVAGVQFKLNGANLGSEDTTAPYSASWDTAQSANGSYTLTAVARDAAGNSATSASVSVTVNNATGGADTTQPTVNVTAPVDGASVSSTVTVTASASDNVGVTGVQFRLNGANLGAEDTTAPYSISWNTTQSADGSYSLTAVARDAAGNNRTSTAITVTVANTPPPSAGVPAWVNALPLWQWYAIPGTALSSVEPSPRPLGNSGPESKISAWCGATLKRQGSWYMLGAAGGHADYAGNEVDAIQLNTATPRWVQLHAPSANSAVIDAQYYLDLKPSATHTYYATQFINARNRMLVVAGGSGGLSMGISAPGGWAYPGSAGRSYSFNFATNQWDAPEYITRYTGGGDNTSGLIAKHPVTEDVYLSYNYTGGWWRWSQANNTWTKLSNTSRGPWYAGSAIDPIRNRVFVAGGYDPGTPPQVYDLNGIQINVSFGGLGASAINLPAYSGVVYDEANDNFLTFHNSGGSIAVHRVNPQTWAVDRPSTSGTPPASRPRGVHNAIQYVPELKGVAIANSYGGNMYFMRTAQ